jgi:hypothetical protein
MRYSLLFIHPSAYIGAAAADLLDGISLRFLLGQLLFVYRSSGYETNLKEPSTSHLLSSESSDFFSAEKYS